jgi:hypothetical protein
VKELHQQVFIIFVFGTIGLIQVKKVVVEVIVVMGSSIKSAVVITFVKIRRGFLFTMANIKKCIAKIKKIPDKMKKKIIVQEEVLSNDGRQEEVVGEPEVIEIDEVAAASA